MTRHVTSLSIMVLALAALVTMWLVVEFVRLLWDTIIDWRREREWRAAAQRSRVPVRDGVSPMSPVLHVPRLGERYWLAHDASDPTKGGMTVDVVLLDRVGGVHREVPLARLSRMPE